MKERRLSVANHDSEDLRFGFSPEIIGVIARFTDPATIPQLSKGQRGILRDGIAFLNLSSGGLQWVDFGNRQDSNNLDRKREARSIVVDIIYPMLFPGQLSVPRVISREEVKQIHKMILSFRGAVRDMEREIALFEESRKLLPQMLVFFGKVNEKLAERQKTLS